MSRQCVLAIVWVAANLLLVGSPAEAWRVDIPGSGAPYSYSAIRDVAFDAAGNVVAAGYLAVPWAPNQQFLVTKYDALSAAPIGSAADGCNAGIGGVAAGLAVDAAANLIAVGTCFNPLGADFAVVKYDSAGAQIWRRDVDGSGGSADQAVAVGLDAAGDVMVLGWSPGSLLVVKLATASGNELWRRTITGEDTSEFSETQAYGIAIDAAGNPVIAAALDNNTFFTGTTEFLVAKLSGSTGVVLWQREIAGTTLFGLNGARAVGIDGDGDVFAAGYLDNVESFIDFGVVKLDGATGGEIWRDRRYGGEARALAVTATGDVVACGVRTAGGAQLFHVLKFSGFGPLEWWHWTYDLSSGSCNDVAVTPSGETIAGGTVSVDVNGDGHRQEAGIVMGLSFNSGLEIWEQQMRGRRSTDNYPDGWVTAIAVGGTAEVAAGGFVNNHLSDLDGMVAHFDASGGSTMTGRALSVRDDAGDPNARYISFTTSDRTFNTPLAFTSTDPTLELGAEVTLRNPLTGESDTFVLPAGPWWTRRGVPPGRLGYRYYDPDGINGPCTDLYLQHGKGVKLRCKASKGPINFTLDEATQGALTVSIRLGAQEGQQCTNFGGAVTRDEGTANPGPKGYFKATDAPIAGACPAP